MERTLIKETTELVGTTVKLQGWAETVRDMGKLTFIDLRDRSGKIQIVGYQLMKDVTTESVIEVIGEVKKRPEKMINPEMETGSVELDVKEYKILNKADPLAIPVIETGMNETETDKRMDFRWIDLRKEKNFLIYKVWTQLEKGFRDYLLNQGFIQIHSPKIMSNPSESGAEVFEIKYFDEKAYLAQSPQFYKQMAMAAGFERVFEIGPVFRAEPSNTIRHATEFTSYDLEISYIESHEDLMKLEEEMIVFMFKSVKESLGEEIEKKYGIEIEIPALPFPRITMSELKKILKEKGIPSEESANISSIEEKAIGEYIKETYNHDFVFITEYGSDVRAFYHMRPEDNQAIAKGGDLIYKGIEITTFAQREHRYEILRKQAEQRGFDLNGSINDYLQFFQYGCPPHGGMALGFSRIIMKMLNLHSVREVMYLFRGPRRIKP